MADRSPGWLKRAGLATQRQPAPPNEATTRATDGARMRNQAKAAAEQAGTLRRHAHAAQERVNALTKQTLRKTRKGR
jgi:hypothetical protein